MKNHRCEICGGSATCPANTAGSVYAPIKPGDVVFVRNGHPAPPTYRRTHQHGYRSIWVAPGVTIVGTAHAGRINAHFDFDPEWVGPRQFAVRRVAAPVMKHRTNPLVAFRHWFSKEARHA